MRELGLEPRTYALKGRDSSVDNHSQDQQLGDAGGERLCPLVCSEARISPVSSPPVKRIKTLLTRRQNRQNHTAARKPGWP